MKRILSGLTVALCVCAAEGSAWAQAAPTEYHAVLTYIMTAPGMQDAYRDQLVNVSTKFYEEMLKEQPTLVHWSAASVMYPGLENNSFNYVTAAVYAGPPPEPSVPGDAIFQKVSGLTRVEYQKKLNTLRTVVATELVRSVSRLSPSGTLKVGDFRVTSQVRIRPGMGSEFADLIQAKMQPVMELRRSAGELKSWSAWTRQFPSGAASTYDALVVSYYKDLASAVKGLDASKTAEVFARAHPGKSYAAYVNDMRDYAEVQNRGLHRVVALVERPAPATTR
jgi:hypothetical protein